MSVRPAQQKTTSISQFKEAAQTAMRAQKKQDPWRARDVAPQTMAPRAGERGTIAAAAARFHSRVWMMLGYLVMAGSVVGAFAAARYVPAPAVFTKTGTLVVESKPQGVELLLRQTDKETAREPVVGSVEDAPPQRLHL